MNDYSKLKAAALAATPGPWYIHEKPDMEGGNYGIDNSDCELDAEAVVWWGGPRCGIWKEEDAAFIAAANPAAVLQLIAALAVEKEQSAYYEKQMWYFHGLAESESERCQRQTIADGNEILALEARNKELEASETKLIAERDNTEAALNAMYRAVMGESPEWSNLYWYAHGVEDVAQRTADLEQRLQQPALADVMAERQRQISAEGWTPEHDDEHEDGELAIAAASYALQAGACPFGPLYNESDWPDFWPWDVRWWKPTNPRRDLVKAGALILAEIERLDRAAKVEGE
ncbi:MULTISPECIES: hypothetical protein [unclassified Serratia (in: enterobacteria)]|uniref:hypothetical protein n=1 Tax=unclassified Serratia (in: enterobacteria) TaxID=2647522 RepID=UPI0030766F30